MPPRPKDFTITIKTKDYQELFSLAVQHKSNHTLLTMKAFTKYVTTREIPQTYEILKKHLPRVLHTRCFNDQKLPFSEEVKATELGHLLEHILLQYLCQEKVTLGCTEATYNGVTMWNWEKYPYGTFHITIDSGFEDLAIFPFALQKAVTLFQQILQSTSNFYKQQTFVTTQDTPAILS